MPQLAGKISTKFYAIAIAIPNTAVVLLPPICHGDGCTIDPTVLSTRQR
jgi:hypothetical protein